MKCFGIANAAGLLLLLIPFLRAAEIEVAPDFARRLAERIERSGIDTKTRPQLDPQEALHRFIWVTPGKDTGILELSVLLRHRAEIPRLIEEVLAKETLYGEEIGRLPEVAAELGGDYEAEIARKLIFHSGFRKYDDGLIGYPASSISTLHHLFRASEDQEFVLDRLIAEGRIPEGSVAEQKWRKKFHLVKQARARDSNRSSGAMPGTGKRDAEITDGEQESATRAPRFAIVMFLALVCAAGCLRIIWKRKGGERG